MLKGKVDGLERVGDTNYVLIKVRLTPSRRKDQIDAAYEKLKPLIKKDVLLMID